MIADSRLIRAYSANFLFANTIIPLSQKNDRAIEFLRGNFKIPGEFPLAASTR